MYSLKPAKASNNILQNSQNVDERESNANLHTAEQTADNPLGPLNILLEGARGLFDASDQYYGTINICTDDFTPREIDTRTKEKPSARDIGNINAVNVITEMMSKNDISPTGEPFSYSMWKANCVLYSVVSAFLNQRPVTCLDTLYKWFTSCTLGPMEQHLDKYGLMEVQLDRVLKSNGILLSAQLRMSEEGCT